MLDWGNERPDPLSTNPVKKHVELLRMIEEYRNEYDGLISTWNG